MKPSELVTLARRIAPLDLADWPIYVLLTSGQLPAEFRTPAVCGMTRPSMDLASQPFLESRGRWEGRGVCIVLNDEQIREQAVAESSGDPEFAGQLFRSRLMAVFVHELAHSLSTEIAPPEDHPAAVGALTRLSAAIWKPPEERQEAPQERFPRPWNNHGPEFLRPLCHLATRAEGLLNTRLAERWLLLPQYCLSRWFLYADSLASEIDDMATEPFSTIREAPLPEPFLQLWRADLSAFYLALESEK